MTKRSPVQSMQKLDPILSNRDKAVLIFLWKHRIATFEALKTILFPDLSGEQAYYQLSRLKYGQYAEVVKLEGTRNYVWCLGKRGFRYLVASQLSGAKIKGYRPQSQYHDLLVAGALLGRWAVTRPKNVTIISEQELAALEQTKLPRDLRKKMDHQPDGLWLFHSGRDTAAVALEVEISGKASDRYEQICAFYASEPFFRHVIWIVENWSLGKRILEISKIHGGNRDSLHLFVEQADFEKSEWDAKTLNESVGRVRMGKLLTSLANDSMELPHPSMLDGDCTSAVHGLKNSQRSPFLQFSLTLTKLATLRNLRPPEKS